jgi:hypothetical protein
MNIQSSIASYNSSQSYKSAQQRDISPVLTERSTTSETNYATNVTISQEAKALLANTSSPTQERTDAQKELLRIAASDKSTTAKLASDMANSQSRVFFDIRGQRGVGDGQGEFALKLSSTGKIVDDEYVAKFNKEASAIDEQRKLIYNTERAKGTDPLKILEKMIDFTNTQSQDYLEATGWIAKKTA